MSVMRPLTEEMLHTVLEQMRRWKLHSSVRLHVPVAVNVAAPNLVDSNFADTCTDCSRSTGCKQTSWSSR